MKLLFPDELFIGCILSCYYLNIISHSQYLDRVLKRFVLDKYIIRVEGRNDEDAYSMIL
jgi:energy-converting hydrogenase Eha subunit C